MPIAFVSTGTYAAPPSLPAGVQDNDVAVLVNIGGAPPGAWTKVPGTNFFYWQRKNAGVSLTAATGAAGQIALFRGMKTTDSPVESGIAAAEAGIDFIVPPAIQNTVQRTGALAMLACWCRDGYTSGANGGVSATGLVDPLNNRLFFAAWLGEGASYKDGQGFDCEYGLVSPGLLTVTPHVSLLDADGYNDYTTDLVIFIEADAPYSAQGIGSDLGLPQATRGFVRSATAQGGGVTQLTRGTIQGPYSAPPGGVVARTHRFNRKFWGNFNRGFN